jgi:hypothetical protein
MPLHPYPGISAFFTARFALPAVRADSDFFSEGVRIPYFKKNTPF